MAECADQETLSSLTYMDNVVREVLRLYSPVPTTIRETAKDVIVPLGTPVLGRDGKAIDNVRLPKGLTMFVRKSIMHHCLAKSLTRGRLQR